MTPFPFVSVIVCAFNEENLIHTCLEGLAVQTYPADQYEVLIIDDESTDKTFDIVSEFIYALKEQSPHMRLLRIKHGGLSVARNAGIQLSKGEIVAFIDGDAKSDPHWLENLILPFTKGADYVGGRINLMNTDSWVARFLQGTRHRQFFGPHIFNDQCIGCNMAFRKSVFSSVGGFYENFIARGDESTLQERLRGRFQYMPAPDAVVLHERPDTVTAAIRVTWESAMLSHLVRRASGRGISWREIALIVEQFLLTLFPALLFVVWFNPPLLLIPLSLAIFAVLRRLYIRPLNRAIARGLIQEYGIIRGTVGHVVFGFLFNIFRFIGQAVSPWLYRNEDIIQPMTSKVLVLSSVEKTSKTKNGN